MPTIKSLKKEIEYGYHKWKKQLLIAVIVLVVLLFGLFGLEYVLIASYFLLILYLIITKRKILLFCTKIENMYPCTNNIAGNIITK